MFISGKEFLEQPEYIQKELMDYWTPSIGDLAISRGTEKSIVVIMDVKEDRVLTHSYVYDINDFKKEFAPALTEGQLRKFIEDRVGYIDVTITDIEDGNGNIKYEIECYKYTEYDGFEDVVLFKVQATDLFKAYWLVVCQIIDKARAEK